MLSRRTFTAGALALAAAAPLTAGAQQPRVRRIAWVQATRQVAELSLTGWAPAAALIGELARAGLVEGQTLLIERYTGLGVSDRDALMRQVVATAPEVIFIGGAAGLAPSIVAATKTIPIVFFALDPVRAGLVSNLPRPGGNITGFAADTGREFDTKRLQLLTECLPSARRIAYLNPQYAFDLEFAGLADAAARAGVSLVPVIVDRPPSAADYRAAFERIATEHVDALFVGNSAENLTYASLISGFASAAHLPASYSSREFTDAGGLMAYGPDQAEQYRRAGDYVARILKGAKAGDLPVQQPERFYFIINLKTAKALGLTVPEGMLVFATEVIE